MNHFHKYMQLTEQQKGMLETYLAEYRAYEKVGNAGEETPYKDFDQLRVDAILALNNLTADFISGKTTIEQFKEASESLCRKSPYWGFVGFSGQMQLNQYVNNIQDEKKTEVLRRALIVPKDQNEIQEKIDSVFSFLQEQKSRSTHPQSIPRTSQAFLLSYFWEVQEPEKWPVYYGSTKKMLIELGFDLDSYDTPGDEYLVFNEAIKVIRSFLLDDRGINEKHPVWFVEHLLWTQFAKSSTQKAAVVVEKKLHKKSEVEVQPVQSWIPPVISDLPVLAENKETPWSMEKGVKPEKALETKLRFAFTLLGYEVTELGQGTGREPDGVAMTPGGSGGDYAIVYDAKAREKEYSMGTDDRSIIEYIKKKQDELKRQRIIKLSFVIVSSGFANSEAMNGALLNIFRETRVPVILIQARDLLYIIETKLKHADIDLARLENLFLERGQLTREKIVEVLGA